MNPDLHRFDLARAVLDEAITFWELTGGTPEDLRRCRKMRVQDSPGGTATR